MSVNTVYPRELEQQELTSHQYCRGCILFLKHADQQHPKLMLQAGVEPDIYGHPVLVLSTNVPRNGLRCIRVAVITSCGGLYPPPNWANAYLPIWPKAASRPDAPQLFLGEGRTLPKASYVCLRNTRDFDKSMLSPLVESAEPYFFHLTRQSFNIVAEKLEYSPMKLLDDRSSPETMTLPPARANINPGRTAGTTFQPSAQQEKQWIQICLQRRLKDPERVAQYLAAWEKDNNTGSGKALEAVFSIPPESSHQSTLALSRLVQERNSTSSVARQPVPLSPLSQVNITSSPPSLTPASVHDLTKRLQTIRPPQLTKETHHTTKAKKHRSMNGFAMRPRFGNAQRPFRGPTASRTLSFYDFLILSLMLLARALWFFLKVFIFLTYKTMAWALSVFAGKTSQAIRGWVKNSTAAVKQRLQVVADEAKKTVREVLEQQ